MIFLNNIFLMMGQGEGEQNPYSFFIMMILIIVVFYFFMIRPQMRKQKEIKQYRQNLQKGDKVVTVGGIYGKIIEVSEKTVLLDVGGDVKLKVDKNGLLKDAGDLANQK